MACYPSIPLLTRRERVGRLLLVSLFIAAVFSVYAIFPALLEGVRGLSPWTSMLAGVMMWVFILVQYSRTILGVETDAESLVIRTRAGKRVIPKPVISEIEPVRKKGKLVRVRLRDACTRPLGVVPIVAGYRRIERAEDLLAELESLERVRT